jgi:hypothetical protein
VKLVELDCPPNPSIAVLRSEKFVLDASSACAETARTRSAALIAAASVLPVARSGERSVLLAVVVFVLCTA